MATTITIKQHDTWPPLVAILSDANGVIDLTTATTVKLLLKSLGAGSTVVSGTCTVDAPPTQGQVTYDWQPADTASVNTFNGEFEITWSNGKITTVPNDSYFTVEIKADLG